MAKVKVLEKQIYELIAAGEVINRPKFAVKELVENSIDAKSSSIDVEIRNGGKTLIRIIDDGCGMSYDDCKLAFLRHATSKISDVSDLNSIQTLGFRGEALASICAVSKVEVITKVKGSEFGTRYVNHGGDEQICERVNCNDGTCFSVEQLFYNLPARSKFLKSDVTEANLIQDIIEKLAISHPEISFSFKKNGKKLFQTLGNGNLGSAIYTVLGKDVFKTLIPVKNTFSDIEVWGYVNLPIFCKARGVLNLSFVNLRYIKSKIIKSAVEEAFKGFSMIGKFPSFILFLKLPFSDIDINVHPAKTEIRFLKEINITKAIYLAVKKAIDKSNDVFEQKYSTKTQINQYNSTENLLIDCGFESEVSSYKIDGNLENFADLYNLKSENNILKEKDKQKNLDIYNNNFVADNSLNMLVKDNNKVDNIDNRLNVTPNLNLDIDTGLVKDSNKVDDIDNRLNITPNLKLDIDTESVKDSNKVDNIDNRLNVTPNLKSDIDTESVKDSNKVDDIDNRLNIIPNLKSDIDTELVKDNDKVDNIDNKLNIIPNLKSDIDMELNLFKDVFKLRLIGEVFKTYILAEYKDKFIVVDKHAAHERIIYEKLQKELNSFEKQTLISPLKVYVNSNNDCELILQKLDIFNYFGFEVEQFGNHNFLIRQVPAFLAEENCLEVFNEILDNLKMNKFDLTPETVENILHSMACKSAIKANDINSNDELYEIIKTIYFDDKIRTCPHGRPVILVFSKERFESDFKRRQ